MIDTEKYEGHTPAPWDITNDGILGVTEPENVTLHIFSGCYSESDAQLIKDAPLILDAYKEKCEEVKRLRKELKEAKDVIQYALEMSNDDDSTRVFEDYLEVMNNE